jgi:hypothetical protein
VVGLKFVELMRFDRTASFVIPAKAGIQRLFRD